METILHTLSQLGIDGPSMVFYLVNFGSLLVLLTVILYKPLLGYLEKRQKAISDSVTEAQQLQELLDKERSEMAASREAMRAEITEQLESMKKHLREQEATMLKEIEEKRSLLLAQAKEQIDAEKASIMKEVEGKTIEMIKQVVLYVVQNKVPENVVTDSVNEAWKSYTS